MRKIVVLQIVAFYLFSCLVTYAQSQRYKGYPKKDTDIPYIFVTEHKI